MPELRTGPIFLAAVLFAGVTCTGEAGDPDGSGRASRVTEDVALAEDIPFLSVNLNNYKHPAHPLVCGGAKGAWDEAGIERPVVLRLGPVDWRMRYACAGPRKSIGLATSKDGVRWARHAGNPVWVPSEAWEQDYMSPTIEDVDDRVADAGPGRRAFPALPGAAARALPRGVLAPRRPGYGLGMARAWVSGVS